MASDSERPFLGWAPSGPLSQHMPSRNSSPAVYKGSGSSWLRSLKYIAWLHQHLAHNPNDIYPFFFFFNSHLWHYGNCLCMTSGRRKNKTPPCCWGLLQMAMIDMLASTRRSNVPVVEIRGVSEKLAWWRTFSVDRTLRSIAFCFVGLEVG